MSSLAPLSMNPESGPKDLDYTPDNPQTEDIDKVPELVGDDDKNKLVSIITSYRTGWAPDRLLRLARWQRNDFMFRNHQILGWDQSNGVYYDALAYYMQSGQQQSGDTDYLARFQNNITKMLGLAFVGAMSRTVPPTVIRPESAQVEADVTTAKFGQEAIGIIERVNDIDGLIRKEDTFLYLYGMYAKHTSVTIDKRWGYEEEPDIQTVPNLLPDRYRCSECGKETPANAGDLRGSNEGAGRLDVSGDASAQGTPSPSPMESQPGDATGSGAGMACSNCGALLGSADFWPSEKSTEDINIGVKRKPRAMVTWDIAGPFEFDADPQANKVVDSPIVARDREVDIGWARMTFPGVADKIKEGMSISTTPNADYERLRRNESYSQGVAYTADSFQQKPTYSEVWIQPQAYYRMYCDEKDANGKTFQDRMLKAGPDGLKLAMLGSEVVSVQKATLEKEWTVCLLVENCGLYPPSVADDVVPFNIRINGAMDIMDEFFETSTVGITLADSATIDRREISGKTMVPGELNFVRKTGKGVDTPLANSLWQFLPQMTQDIFKYIPMLWTYAEQIAGLPPQLVGIGTQEGVDTATGQKQQQNSAETKLNIFFENQKVEHAAAAENAIWWLQQASKEGLIKELWSVEEASGSQFRNNEVDLNKMNGRIRVYPKSDEGLPQSPEAQRAIYEQIFKEYGEGNELAKEIMKPISNQETMLSSMLGDGFVLDSADQRNRTLQHIGILMAGPPKMVVNQQTGELTPDLPVKPEIGTDDWRALQDTMKEFKKQNWDSQAANPQGWARVNQYQQLAKQMEAEEAAQDAELQKKVQQAGAPDPDPTLEQAKQLLLTDAAAAVGRNAAVGASPPAPTGVQMAPIVSANKSIIDAAMKAAK